MMKVDFQVAVFVFDVTNRVFDFNFFTISFGEVVVAHGYSRIFICDDAFVFPANSSIRG